MFTLTPVDETFQLLTAPPQLWEERRSVFKMRNCTKREGKNSKQDDVLFRFFCFWVQNSVELPNQQISKHSREDMTESRPRFKNSEERHAFVTCEGRRSSYRNLFLRRLADQPLLTGSRSATSSRKSKRKKKERNWLMEHKDEERKQTLP